MKVTVVEVNPMEPIIHGTDPENRVGSISEEMVPVEELMCIS